MRRFYVIILLFIAIPLSAQRLRVAFIGDPQVDDETELGYARRSIYAELGARKDLDLAIFLGDLVNDDVALLVPTRAILDSLPFPWACVPGNHDRDFYGLKKGRAVSFDRTVQEGKARDMASYTRIIGSPDTSFVMGGVRFIMMDDVRNKGGQGYEGGFREDQKAWLAKQLSATPEKMPAVLCAHIPFSEFKALDSLEAILSAHPKMLLMCGHTHTMARHLLEFPGGLALEEVLAGAACGSWWRGIPDEQGIPSATQNCGSPRCYYLADFSRRGYCLDYKVIGRPAKEKASAWIADSTRLVLNIYGGSTEGEVQVKLPGCRWIDVPRSREPAPEVLAVVEFNRSLPKKRRSRNHQYIPLRTVDSPHIWAVNMKNDPELLEALQKAEGKEIKIRYRDPDIWNRRSAPSLMSSYLRVVPFSLTPSK